MKVNELLFYLSNGLKVNIVTTDTIDECFKTVKTNDVIEVMTTSKECMLINASDVVAIKHARSYEGEEVEPERKTESMDSDDLFKFNTRSTGRERI